MCSKWATTIIERNRVRESERDRGIWKKREKSMLWLIRNQIWVWWSHRNALLHTIMMAPRRRHNRKHLRTIYFPSASRISCFNLSPAALVKPLDHVNANYACHFYSPFAGSFRRFFSFLFLFFVVCFLFFYMYSAIQYTIQYISIFCVCSRLCLCTT